MMKNLIKKVKLYLNKSIYLKKTNKFISSC